MKSFYSLVGAVVLFASIHASAITAEIARPVYLRNCGFSAHVELREAQNGAYSLQLVDLNPSCYNLRFFDVSSGRTLKSYPINGTNYTLSKADRESLSEDCALGVSIAGSGVEITYYIQNCRPVRPAMVASGDMGITYELSGNNNCKLMVRGVYKQPNVSVSFCAGARKGDVTTFGYTVFGNCKRMINGLTIENVSDYFCSANKQ
jgi:hypothetical protein